jgi:hypothetical protein
VDRERVDDWIAYHGRIARSMTVERTALESALIPVTAYILVAGVECYRRYPELLSAITDAMPADAIGAAGRRPGNQVDAVHLWSIVNIPLIGRQVLMPFGLTDPATDDATMRAIFSFWGPAAAAFRADGSHQAFDVSPRAVQPYAGAAADELLAACKPLDGDDARVRLGRVNATLTSFCFLLYFDTRAGYQDTGPYALPDGRTLLVREFSRIGVSDFAWSADVCRDIPYGNVTVALVLEGMQHVEVTDWGTSITEPTDYLPCVAAAGVFATADDGTQQPLGDAEIDELSASVKDAQRALYRRIAGMSRAEKIDAGAYVYFTFLRPFAAVAGVAEALDWSVPRDSRDLYEGLSTIDRAPDIDPDTSTPYYFPLSPLAEVSDRRERER